MSSKFSKYQGVLTWVTILAIFAILGYFTYGGINGALAMVVMYFVVSFTTLFALVPYAGIFVQNYVTTGYVFPYLFTVTGTYPTVLTDAIYVIFLVFSVFIWLLVSAMVSIALYAIFSKR